VHRMATELLFPRSVRLVNRVDVLEASPERVVISVVNEPATLLLLRLNRGDIRVLYFFDHEAGTDVWRYFTVTSLKGLAATSPPEFLRNSARAIFRYSAGLPTDVPAP
jgi:hypothetical protein